MNAVNDLVQFPTGAYVDSANRGIKKLKYYDPIPRALLDIGLKLNAHPHTAGLGRNIIIGICWGLKSALTAKFPVCPFCGKRHKPPSSSLFKRSGF